ncbi:hypothetical protein D081_2025 [Anaerovibrio sp. JC8]|uniref:hypothetical protein n=1 Tax=Anaerovibrio sp. JC8 TaxID=1240085 RepID=UPI000A0E465F|nr:hypothetical protein [Anaerovibrio sp. JC8]ORT99296.1 hypothetical protein D081_2025 [Anaerovibrio sp. JC8]
MSIAIIDADLLGRTNHRFPNLVCMKLSAYWKEQGKEVELKTDYDNLSKYERVYIAKVFTDTYCPITLDNVKEYDNVEIGGTGFWFDKAPNLPDEIEHHMPDYHLYDKWIELKVKDAKESAIKAAEIKTRSLKEQAVKDGLDPELVENVKVSFNEDRFRVQFKEYTDYSIGFLTRGCFRKCPFCVNQKYNRVFEHSKLEEFYDESRKKICLLDDNFFGYHRGYKPLLEKLRATGKPFKFKQGMDERVLDDEQCELLFSSKYDGDFTFAFDNVSDYELIHRQLKRISKYRSKRKGIMFYVLVGFESTDAKDIENAFIRIDLLLRYGCLPYIMRYRSKNDTPWKNSKYRSMYVTIARWCNQPSIIKKMSFRDFCNANQALHKTKGTLCSSMKALTDFEKEYPEIAAKYFDVRFIPPSK